MIKCQQPQAHPDRCGCVPQGTEQVSSAWLAQLREEYRLFGGENKRLSAENAALAQRCRELEVERDEADRRAGAAERKLDFEVDSRRRRDSWLRKAKEEAGYSQNETFDRAWAETLGKANERDTLRAEVEQLRKDAERLDKLQSLAWYRHGFEDDAGVDGLDTLLIDAQGDVRAAIDAALEASR